jgi:hypothetical protein
MAATAPSVSHTLDRRSRYVRTRPRSTKHLRYTNARETANSNCVSARHRSERRSFSRRTRTRRRRRIRLERLRRVLQRSAPRPRVPKWKRAAPNARASGTWWFEAAGERDPNGELAVARRYRLQRTLLDVQRCWRYLAVERLKAHARPTCQRVRPAVGAGCGRRLFYKQTAESRYATGYTSLSTRGQARLRRTRREGRISRRNVIANDRPTLS